MTIIDFRTDPVTARRHRVVSLVTLADIQDIVWADDETGCYGVKGRDLKANQSSRSGLGRSGLSPRGGDQADRDMPNFWRALQPAAGEAGGLSGRPLFAPLDYNPRRKFTA